VLTPKGTVYLCFTKGTQSTDICNIPHPTTNALLKHERHKQTYPNDCYPVVSTDHILHKNVDFAARVHIVNQKWEDTAFEEPTPMKIYRSAKLSLLEKTPLINEKYALTRR